MWMRDVISFSMMLNVVGGCHNASFTLDDY